MIMNRANRAFRVDRSEHLARSGTRPGKGLDPRPILVIDAVVITGLTFEVGMRTNRLSARGWYGSRESVGARRARRSRQQWSCLRLGVLRPDARGQCREGPLPSGVASGTTQARCLPGMHGIS